MVSCATTKAKIKIVPEYKGIDERVQHYYDEYIFLAKQNGIVFHNPVTIGLKNLDGTDAIGLCHYGLGFREIDIDEHFWLKRESLEKQALIYHELTHCLCSREEHDYAKGKLYSETGSKRDDDKGYFDDGCPISIMTPNLAPAFCVSVHWTEYVKEMFDRCAPW